jgi:hypothetical protein
MEEKMSDDYGTMPGEADGHRCEEEGCESFDAIPCFLMGEDDPNGYFCSEHAHAQGFCYICGQFWGGIESFDFGPGYCEHCRSEVEADAGDYDDDDVFELPEYEP